MEKLNKNDKFIGNTIVGLIIAGVIIYGLISFGIIPKEFANHVKYMSSSAAVIIGGYVLLQSFKQEKSSEEK